MGFDVDAGGNLVTAGLAAAAVESRPGLAGDGIHCANCQTVLTGPYCSQCGQKGKIHRSIFHLGEELAHGTLHFDAKAWRTLPMLAWKPGELTRRYIDGQRARFVSPLALFLFMVFLMFFVLSLTMKSFDKDMIIDDKANAAARAEISKTVERERATQRVLADKLAAAKAAGPVGSELQAEIERNRLALKAAEATLAAVDKGIKDGKMPSVSEGIAAASKGIQIDSGWAWLDNAARKSMDNPDLSKYKLKSAAYKYAFLLVPISLPFIWLLFCWKRNVTMYDHAVFTLYSLSFMSMLFIVVAVLDHYGWEALARNLLFFVPPIHMYRQVKAAYGLSRFGAVWRTLALLFVAMLVVVLYIITVLGLSAG